MHNRSLLYGIIGFLIGGLVTSIAATYVDKPQDSDKVDISMAQMSDDLKDLSGDAYDQKFIEHMIQHHEGAVDMAELSASRAKHPEIKKLSEEIITAQKKEIADMVLWHKDWGYSSAGLESSGHTSH